jgi:hypothetical protein
VTEAETFVVIRASIASVWELELLLLLLRSPKRNWKFEELIRELRASSTVVSHAVAQLCAQGFAKETSRSVVQFHPADAIKYEFIRALDALYAAKPVTVIKEIMSRPDARLKTFSDAFRFRD